MFYYDFNNARCGGCLPEQVSEQARLFIVCSATELPKLSCGFYLDASTVKECTDFYESVRYAAFEGYDFISAVALQDDFYAPEEINLYVAANYCILVLPDEPSRCARSLASALTTLAESMLEKADARALNRIYFMFWQGLLAQYSDVLRQLEKDIEVLSESLLENNEQNPFNEVNNLRRRGYNAKKYLRAQTYLCAQTVTDINGLLDSNYMRLFKGIKTRTELLYDFACNLYTFSGELLEISQSHVNMRTNRIMNKLTLITMFFAPLTVITGIYGMNFRFMPELNWSYGYFAAIALMAAVCGGLLWLAKHKKWL